MTLETTNSTGCGTDSPRGYRRAARGRLCSLLGICMVLTALAVSGAEKRDVLVKGLTLGRVILQVDGELLMLSDGESRGGIQLIRADTRSAVLDIDGRRVVMGLDQSIARSYSEPQPAKSAVGNQGVIYREPLGNDRQQGRTRIRSVTVSEQSDNRLTLEVDYFYAGDHAGSVRLNAVPTRNGERLEFVTHADTTLAPGAHSTILELALRDDAPLVFQSDSIRFNVTWSSQGRQQGVLANQAVNFNKYWKKVRVR